MGDPTTAKPISPLAFEDLSLASQDLLRPRYERLGYLGEIFGVLGNDDAVLRAFVGFADASASPVDQDVREVVALAIAAATDAEPELFQHERRALRLGFTSDEIAAIETLDPDHSDLRAGTRDVRAASAAAARGDWAGARAALAKLSTAAGPSVAAGVLLQIGYYLMATSMGHILALTPPVTSIFGGQSGD